MAVEEGADLAVLEHKVGTRFGSTTTMAVQELFVTGSFHHHGGVGTRHGPMMKI
jgi:hypothetical protein